MTKGSPTIEKQSDFPSTFFKLTMNPAIESRSPNFCAVTAVHGCLFYMTLTDVQVHLKSGKGGSLAVELPYPAEKKTACLHLTQLSLHRTMLSTIGLLTFPQSFNLRKKTSFKSYLFATWIFLAPTHQRFIEGEKRKLGRSQCFTGGTNYHRGQNMAKVPSNFSV